MFFFLLAIAALLLDPLVTKAAYDNEQSYKIPETPFEISLPVSAIYKDGLIKSEPEKVNGVMPTEDYFFFTFLKLNNVSSVEQYINQLCFWPENDGYYDNNISSLDGGNFAGPNYRKPKGSLEFSQLNNEVTIYTPDTNCSGYIPVALFEYLDKWYQLSVIDLGIGSNGENLRKAIETVKISSITEGTFSDMYKLYTFFEAVESLNAKKIISGYLDGTFRPFNLINRAEFTKIVVNAAFPEEVKEEKNCFPDVQEEWFAPYVCFAQSHNLIAGYPNGEFKPAENINVAEAAKIVVNAFGLNVEQQEETQAWYTPFMNALESSIPSSANNPGHLLTRGEMVEIVWRVKGK